MPKIVKGIGPAYQYDAIVKRYYDGDSFPEVWVDLGLGQWDHKVRIRFAGINTDELRQRKKDKKGRIRTKKEKDACRARARRALAVVVDRVGDSGKIVIQSKKIEKTIGKFGRLLAIVWYPVYNTDGSLKGHVNLCDELMELGLAVEYMK